MTGSRLVPDSTYDSVWQTILAMRRPLVLSHANADADAVSSVMAVYHAVARHGRNPTAAVGDGTIPPNLTFIPAADRISNPDGLEIDRFDGIVIVDCADIERLGPLYKQHPDWFDGRIPVVNIDHHITNRGYGQASLVDAQAAATCEILACLIECVSVPLTVEIATCLLAGIYGDTLALRTPSTTGRTLRITANLLDAGGDLMTVVDQLFRLKPFSTIRLWGEALARTQIKDGVIWTEVTPEMLQRSEAKPSEGEGLVNFISECEGASVGAILYKQRDGWRVSLRTMADNIDVAEIAALYGGGGHSRAAGCSLPAGDAVRDQFLEDVAKRVAAATASARQSS